ncbi:cytosine/adenosine deaminase-related metal-dependent hydrolase [Erwinia toletana]|uniref:Cytosine/adenosine deaminase-related metal-dependent hydrolase n=1 Tax=Winslowiella toletana TaxID=92490 RepID=A0ABS4PE12_9GAMM|nr:amidohydrolase family protein [Winslowiella toletana]MBP2170871.1 cytosine/adenosine deaminase-related metal-dependent hydrolase [Winslowiella toletana]
MQTPQQQSRRNFLTKSALVTAGSAMLASGISAAATTTPVTAACADSAASVKALNATHYRLINVRLEEGFEREGDTVIATRTGLYHLEIHHGKIIALQPASTASNSALPTFDAQGLLLLPATRDMHIHLDKTFYGGAWQAPRPRKGKTIMDMIAREQQLIPQLLPTSVARAEAIIALLQSRGTTVARSHCNIDPVSGLKSLEHLQLALEKHQQDFSCEIVAFPQHGLLHSKVDGLMREAMQMGVQFVGGLDPTNVDGAMENSLDAMFRIALDNDKGVDIHLHETTPAGVAAINYMIRTVKENPALKGKVTLSHGFALATLSGNELDTVIAGLAEQQFTVASTVPLGKLTMPLPQLSAQGVRVVTGTDSVIDHWSPFGSGSMLDKASLYAQLYGNSDEFGLTRSLAIATGDILPLNHQGQRQWPAVDDPAEMMLVEASCSAEAVARVSPVKATFHQGKLVSGSVKSV